MLIKHIPFENLYVGMPVMSKLTGRTGFIYRLTKKDAFPIRARHDELEVRWSDTSPSTVVSHVSADTIECQA